MKPGQALAIVERAALALVDPAQRCTTPHLVVEIDDFEEAKSIAFDQQRVFPVEPCYMERLMNAKDYDPTFPDVRFVGYRFVR